MAHIFLTGNVATDPKVRTFERDGAERVVANFQVADHARSHPAASATTFYRVTAWHRLGELAASLAKGSLVHIHGEINAKPDARDHRLEITAREIFTPL
ncbi:MAG: single-stranded DNA-binding protein [Bifidobacteriaceae bacterium]|jgi:single-stranded DNA-binding protein|nr:single-stranded DNA-binding protein [Bifidobacteriaceae bacterium]